MMIKELFSKVGIKIGHYTDLLNMTGITVVLMEEGANIGIDIRGSSIATFNTESYSRITSSREFVHGIVLAGGSTFGLETCFGVLEYLHEKNIGTTFGKKIIPGVVGSVIYDLSVGHESYPTKKDGYLAAVSATQENGSEGNIGVGTGATVGKWQEGKRMKGGFGIAQTTIGDDIIVAALVVTNAIGDIVNPSTGKFYMDNGNFTLKFSNNVLSQNSLLKNHSTNTNTILAIIATNVELEKRQLTKISEMAHDGLARAAFPVHSTLDGDIVFAISSRSGERKTFPKISPQFITDLIGIAASDAVMKAIKRSILGAESLPYFPAYKDLYITR